MIRQGMDDVNRKDKIISALVVIGLLLLSLLGVDHVLKKDDAQSMERFTNRMVKLESLGLPSKGNVTVTYDQGFMKLAWPAMDTQAEIQSDILPLEHPEKKTLQVDMGIGGRKNANGYIREGYQVWVEVRLIQNGIAVKSKRVEILLESEITRSRLYSIRIPYDGAEPDAYQLRWTILPVDGRIDQGDLVCEYLEVMEL